MTCLELISGSLRMIGELSPGQTPSDSDAAAGLELLNAILESWELQHRKVYVIDELQFPLTSNKGTYTMGPDGEFDTYRPVKIQTANIIYSETSDPLDGVSHRLQLVNSLDFAAIPDKGMTALRPLKLYNDNDFPLLNINLWPIPVFS